jgi:hypothetical protein
MYVCMYVCMCITNTYKDCDTLHDRPILSTGRTPHDKQNHDKNLVMSSAGAQRQEAWPTDRQLQRNCESDYC